MEKSNVNKKLQEELEKLKLELEKLKSENKILKKENKFLTQENELLEKRYIKYKGICKFLNNALKELNKLAYHDPLTGLANRYKLDKELQNTKYGYIVMIDVDNFKKINDTYGHKSGDEVLKRVANKIQQIPEAFVERHGGEEFIIVFKNQNPEKVIETMEQIRQEIENTLEYKTEDNEKIAFEIDKKVCGTISIGIAPYIGDKIKALELADLTMYWSKGNYDDHTKNLTEKLGINISNTNIGNKNTISYYDIISNQIILNPARTKKN